MNKKSQKQKRIRNYTIVGIIIFIVALFSFIFYLIIPKEPTITYYTKIIDKIGAPEGFTINPDREYTSSPFDAKTVKRTYVGTAAFEDLRDQMIQRISTAGFKNVHWRDKTDALSAGLVATCKDVYVFVGIQQPNDDPINIEVIKNGDKNAADCPTP